MFFDVETRLESNIYICIYIQEWKEKFLDLKVTHNDVYMVYNLYCEFFMLALANGFSLKFEWQQVSSSLQDSPQYSSWS